MYLSVRKYVNRRDGWGESAVIRPEFGSIIGAVGLDKFAKDERVSIYGANVSVTAAYWRKANQIHNWFVQNVQGGDDDCKEYHVGIGDLKMLIADCETVLLDMDSEDVALDVLPPTNGFFFGADDVDEWYYEDVAYTHKRLSELVDLLEAEQKNDTYYDVFYQSSW